MTTVFLLVITTTSNQPIEVVDQQLKNDRSSTSNSIILNQKVNANIQMQFDY